MGSQGRWAASILLLVLGWAALHAREVTAQETIVVNGLSGAVTGVPAAPLSPGSRFVVRVCPADLLRFRYAIGLDSVLPLINEYGVVGLPARDALSSAAGSATGATGVTTRLLGITEDRELDELLKWIADQAALLTNRASEVAATTDPILAIWEGRAPLTWTGCASYPSQLVTAARTFRTNEAVRLTAIRGYRAEVRARLIRFEALARRIELKLTTDEERTRFLAFEIRVDAFFARLLEDIASLESELVAAGALVSYWDLIRSLHPEPVVERNFLTGGGSDRYLVSVARKRIAATPRSALPDSMASPVDEESIARVEVESRAPHRFNLSIGVASIFKPRVRTFDVAASLDADTLVYAVRARSGPEWSALPVATLGVYFDPVDNYDSDRGVAPLAFIGTELGGGFDTHLFGLGLDFDFGLVLQMAGTIYESGAAPIGLDVDVPLPKTSDGNPAVSEVEERQISRLGLALILSARPSIFQAFKDLVS